MTHVNFYTLSSEDEQSRWQLACRLAEKAAGLGHGVFLQVEHEDAARQLDSLLWEYRPASFLPHGLAAARDGETRSAGTPPVLIGTSTQHAAGLDVLINLSSKPCVEPDKFQKINEILSTDPDILAAGRANYRNYQNLGYSLQTHKL